MIQEQRDSTISARVERGEEMQVVASGEDVVTHQVQVQATQTEVIELSDDDLDVEDQRYGNQSTDVMYRDVAIWNYMDPHGITQGPFSLTLLKFWSDAGYYFGPSFRVWKVGQSPQEAVLLVDLLRYFFPLQ